MKWLNEIPATITAEGKLMLLPADKQERKPAKQLTHRQREIVKQRIASRFKGVLS